MGDKGWQIPTDTEKQGYKFLLDSLREQLLKGKTIEEQAASGHAVTDLPPPPLPKFEPGKKFFRIGEVAELLDVEAHVLRYWESEFSAVRPKKTRSGQRIYDRRDVETLAAIRFLLHTEKFSLQGAKRKLKEFLKAAKTPQPRSVDPRVLRSLACELKSLMDVVRNTPV